MPVINAFFMSILIGGSNLCSLSMISSGPRIKPALGFGVCRIQSAPFPPPGPYYNSDKWPAGRRSSHFFPTRPAERTFDKEPLRPAPESEHTVRAPAQNPADTLAQSSLLEVPVPWRV